MSDITTTIDKIKEDKKELDNGHVIVGITFLAMIMTLKIALLF